jgi:opacity protein-like surface antigen
MNKLLAMLAATAAVGLASSAYAADEATEAKSKVEYKDDGGYDAKRSSKHTTPEGTTHKHESKVDVDVDSKGQVSKEVKNKVSTDPKGPLNKKTDVVKTDVEEKDSGGYKQKTTRKHTDAEGTNVTSKVKTDVEVDAEGNVIENTKTESTVDPKGLLNKTTTTNKTKAVNGQIVEQTQKTDD